METGTERYCTCGRIAYSVTIDDVLKLYCQLCKQPIHSCWDCEPTPLARIAIAIEQLNKTEYV